jgi:nucleoside 2-deoxyribosyltransferase
MPKVCFVIGPIGADGSSTRLAADDFMKYIVVPGLELAKRDYGEPVRADKLSEPGRITSQIIKLLMDADLTIADLTSNNANVYYELSLRHALGKPVIHMAEDGTSLSFDVQDNRTIFYTMHSRSAETTRQELANQIRRVHEKGYKATNPIT